jgi:hypothetical protein
MTDHARQSFSVTALRYPSQGAAACAYERVMAEFRGWHSGDSLYRFALDGEPTVAVLSWTPTGEHLAAIAALPWGEGQPVALPASITQELAQSSLKAAPKRPGRTRRIFRDPAGTVLSDRELHDE